MTQGLGPALSEEILYDKDGNNLAGSFMDYLVPTAVETPARETGHTVTTAPHHPLGAKWVGESATVGMPPAIANAVVDGFAHLAESAGGGGVRNRLTALPALGSVATLRETCERANTEV